MSVNLFPTSEYSLKSPYNRADAVTALSANVMKPEFITIDFLSELADKQLGTYRYFEGTVNDTDFSINHKQYSLGRSTTGSIKFTPQINGLITEIKDGCEIKVSFNTPNPIILLIVPLLPIVFQIIVFPSPVLSIPFSIISLTILFFISRSLYKRRMGKDKEQLELIFKVESGRSYV